MQGSTLQKETLKSRQRNEQLLRGRTRVAGQKRMGQTDMHTDLEVPEVKKVDPKDKDAVEM